VLVNNIGAKPNEATLGFCMATRSSISGLRHKDVTEWIEMYKPLEHGKLAGNESPEFAQNIVRQAVHNSLHSNSKHHGNEKHDNQALPHDTATNPKAWCHIMHKRHRVKPHVSWGTMHRASDQQQWKDLVCDTETVLLVHGGDKSLL
jgi:hypothetical protein